MSRSEAEARAAEGGANEKTYCARERACPPPGPAPAGPGGGQTSALDLALELRDLLARAADEAQRLAEPLRALDARALLDWSEERQAVHDRAKALEARLAATLGDGPRPEAVGAALASVRAAAARLQRVDADNAAHVERSLRVVRGFTSALAPAPEAYDRRGSARAGAR